jgi:hypothetical protein
MKKLLGRQTKTKPNSPELKEIFFRHNSGGENIPVKRSVWKDIYAIYADILFEDDIWHYFHEDTYIIIRCQEQFMEEVIKFLDRRNYLIMKTATWVDNAPVVNLHKDLFTQLFHVNTMFAMRSIGANYGDLYLIHDRISHCFLNNQFLHLPDAFINEYGQDWEVVLLSEYLSGRIKCNSRYNQLMSKRRKEMEK